MPRNRDRSKLVIGIQQRIGSVRNRLGTWAASAGSFPCKIFGHRRGGQSKRMRSSPRHTGVLKRSLSQIKTPFAALALWRLSSASSSPRRAEVGSTTIHDRHLPGDYVNILSDIILSDVSLIKPPPLSRYPGGEARIIPRRSAARQMLAASAAGDTPCGRSSPPRPIGLSSCRACAPDAASISSPPATLAA